jgi:esterase/lipase superfamily enzyme
MDIKGKILLITNRNVNPGNTDLSLFGDDLNPLGAEDLNVATAEVRDGAWHLELLTDAENPDYQNPVSRKVFTQVVKQARDDPAEKNWVLFVHGFNQSLEKNLNKCLEIASYGVNVAAFSWPSNPGPQELWKKLKEYKRARKNARRSVLALERTLEKLTGYVEEFSSHECPINMSLVIHSLGNYVFENYVKSADFGRETRIFSNVVLHQPDVDHRDHHQWVERVSDHARVYVTINQHDEVLDTSDVVNPDRLGNTVRDLTAEGVTYMDFTFGRGVGGSHRPWHEPGKDNEAIGRFYELVFNSRRGEKAPGWEYAPLSRAYQLIDHVAWGPSDDS